MDEFITLSKKIEFSASHRYWNDSWSEEENLKHFARLILLYHDPKQNVLDLIGSKPKVLFK